MADATWLRKEVDGWYCFRCSNKGLIPFWNEEKRQTEMSECDCLRKKEIFWVDDKKKVQIKVSNPYPLGIDHQFKFTTEMVDKYGIDYYEVYQYALCHNKSTGGLEEYLKNRPITL